MTTPADHGTEEIVDIVDAGGAVLFQAPKTEAHQKGLLHRAVVAEIKNRAGDWILVKQSTGRQDAGRYVSPVGGHVSAGESDEVALTREAAEECGLEHFESVKVGEGVFHRKVIGRDENHYFVLYEIHTEAGVDDLRLNHESESCRSFTTPELKKLLKESPEMFGDAFLFVAEKFYPQLLSQ